MQSAAANGHHDLRGSAYRQMIEENHAQTTRLAQQMATLAQQVGDTQATVQQILGSMQAQQAAIDQGWLTCRPPSTSTTSNSAP
ncbi:MAG: hypothetical protein HZY76_04915 [Anaerolineae bacterium]|nr:MAG: hypothetical protein HZY76_04915 [Anaerolineae bacterium]